MSAIGDVHDGSAEPDRECESECSGQALRRPLLLFSSTTMIA